jgi:hypothetical protein
VAGDQSTPQRGHRPLHLSLTRRLAISQLPSVGIGRFTLRLISAAADQLTPQCTSLAVSPPPVAFCLEAISQLPTALPYPRGTAAQPPRDCLAAFVALRSRTAFITFAVIGRRKLRRSVGCARGASRPSSRQTKSGLRPANFEQALILGPLPPTAGRSSPQRRSRSLGRRDATPMVGSSYPGHISELRELYSWVTV